MFPTFSFLLILINLTINLTSGKSSSSSSSNGNNNNHELENYDTQTEHSSGELDKLRLEYNKYKILSHLGINANPDKLRPELQSDFKLNLALNNSSTFQNEQQQQPNKRRKRSLACNQIKNDKDACCLQSFYVNFTTIGWDKWILYPPGYNANYCRGQCDLSHARYYHSTILNKFSNLIGLCCSPRQMAPLSLLYVDESNKVLEKSMPDMIVEACDCA